MKILGLEFYDGRVQEVVQLLKAGGLLVVPAAPALSTIKEDHDYYQALLNADIIIPDSGYMAIIWQLTHWKKVNRISGLTFLRAFFADIQIKQTSKILLVDPNITNAKANLAYLQKMGLNVSSEVTYVAPMYISGNIIDEKLLQIVKEKHPEYIIINLAGGVQEKLGSYIKDNVTYKPAIICTGAAIAFLTGQQARIPGWADRFYLGWLFRIIRKPKIFLPRYFKAIKLMSLLLQYGKKMPFRIILI